MAGKVVPRMRRLKPDPRPPARGRVATRAEVTGFTSKEFHPADWVDPNPDHCWYICDPTIDEEWITMAKRALEGAHGVWYVDGVLVWRGPTSYDAELRPALFIIGNLK